MAFSWTDEMGEVVGGRIEGDVRKAIVAAADFLDAIPKDAKRELLPRWNQGEFASAANDVARAMEQVILAQLQGVTGLERQKAVAIAVRLAYLVRDRGGGDAGWAAVKDALPKARALRRKIARATLLAPGRA